MSHINTRTKISWDNFRYRCLKFDRQVDLNLKIHFVTLVYLFYPIKKYLSPGILYFTVLYFTNNLSDSFFIVNDLFVISCKRFNWNLSRYSETRLFNLIIDVFFFQKTYILPNLLEIIEYFVYDCTDRHGLPCFSFFSFFT